MCGWGGGGGGVGGAGQGAQFCRQFQWASKHLEKNLPTLHPPESYKISFQRIRMKCTNVSLGWLGGAKVLGKHPVPRASY